MASDRRTSGTFRGSWTPEIHPRTPRRVIPRKEVVQVEVATAAAARPAAAASATETPLKAEPWVAAEAAKPAAMIVAPTPEKMMAEAEVDDWWREMEAEVDGAQSSPQPAAKEIADQRRSLLRHCANLLVPTLENLLEEAAGEEVMEQQGAPPRTAPLASDPKAAPARAAAAAATPAPAPTAAASPTPAQPQRQPATTLTTKPPLGGRSSVVLCILAACLVVLTMLFALTFFSSSPPSPSPQLQEGFAEYEAQRQRAETAEAALATMAASAHAQRRSAAQELKATLTDELGRSAAAALAKVRVERATERRESAARAKTLALETAARVAALERTAEAARARAAAADARLAAQPPPPPTPRHHENDLATLDRLASFLEHRRQHIYDEVDVKGEYPRRTTEAVMPLFLRTTALPRGSRVLDLGSGEGYAMQMLREAGMDPIGVTLGSADAAHSRALGFEVDELPIEWVGSHYAAASFDAIWARHILEHSVYPFFMVHELNRLLRPGGFLYVEVPTPRSEQCGNAQTCTSQHEANPNHYSVMGREMWEQLLCSPTKGVGMTKLSADYISVSSGVDPTNSSASLHEDRYIYIIAQKGRGGEVSGAPSVGRNERETGERIVL